MAIPAGRYVVDREFLSRVVKDWRKEATSRVHRLRYDDGEMAHVAAVSAALQQEAAANELWRLVMSRQELVPVKADGGKA